MTKKIEIQNYFNSTNISQSQLKKLLGEPKFFLENKESDLYYEDKKFFNVGSAVDCILTQGEDIFKDEFYLEKNIMKPSQTIISILHEVLELAILSYDLDNVPHLEQLSNFILQSCSNHNYQSNWKDETKLNTIYKYAEYFEHLKLSFGKTILSKEESNLIFEIVNNLRTSNNTKKYFNESLSNDNIQIIHQLPIYFIYEDVQCKALIDLIYINHTNKTIEIIDIKTTSEKVLNFPISMRKFRYDIQQAFYKEAVKYLQEKEDWLSDYTILPSKFIVESTTYPGNPIIYVCNESLIKIGKYGLKQYIVINYENNGYYNRYEEKKGFHELILLYKWYQENSFNTHRDIVLSKGEFNLNWEGIL